MALVTLDVNRKPLTVMSTHFGLVDDEKKEATRIVTELVNECENSCIVMGDLNSSPDSEYAGKLACILKDTMPEPEKQTRTYYGTEEPSYKIDYIFVSDNIRVLDAQIVHEKASDHYPVIAEIEF